MQLRHRSITEPSMQEPTSPKHNSVITERETGSTEHLNSQSTENDAVDGITFIIEEKEDPKDTVQHNNKKWPKIKEHMILRAKQDIVRLVGILLIIIACIVCIGLKVQADFFTPIVTLLIGIIIESPLSSKVSNGS